MARLLLLGALFALTLASCSSVPPLDGASPSLYFKSAEQERVQRRYHRAIEIYKLLQLHFAQNFPLVLEAEFGMAQLYFSWPGHEKEAREHYQNVLHFYERPEIGSDIFPQSFLHLSRQNLEVLGKRSQFHFFPPKTYGVRSYPPGPQTAE